MGMGRKDEIPVGWERVAICRGSRGIGLPRESMLENVLVLFNG